MTGREKSKSAQKSEMKNAECAGDYVAFMETESKRGSEPDGQRLGRVVKALGAGRLEVQFPDGTTEKPTIAKKIRFHGRAATKGDQSNCMGPGDLVIVDGGFLFGKLSLSQSGRAEAVFKRHGIDYPSGFFAIAKATAKTEEQMDEVVEWDRTAELDAEAEETAAREFKEAEDRRKWRPESVTGAPSELVDPEAEAEAETKGADKRVTKS